MTYAACRRGRSASRSNRIEVEARRNEHERQLTRDYALVRIADRQRSSYHMAAAGRLSILPTKRKEATR